MNVRDGKFKNGHNNISSNMLVQNLATLHQEVKVIPVLFTLGRFEMPEHDECCRSDTA